MNNAAPSLAPNDGFPPLAEMYQDQETSARTRFFIGEGSPYLAVPGLLKLDGVRQGGQELLRRLEERVPLDMNQTQHRTDTYDLVRLSRLPDGMPILQRSVKSNDGFWQAGSPIAVTGDWDDAVAYEPPPIEEPKKPQKGQR